MNQILRRSLSRSLITIGLILVAVGWFTKTDITPVGQMDCGCGRRNECITKNRSVNMGLWVTVGGVSLFLAGSTIGFIRRKPYPIPID